MAKRLLTWQQEFLKFVFTGSDSSFVSVQNGGNGPITVRQFSVVLTESRAAKLVELRQTRIPETKLDQGVGREQARIVSAHQDLVCGSFVLIFIGNLPLD